MDREENKQETERIVVALLPFNLMNKTLEIVNDVLLDYAAEMNVTPSQLMTQIRKRLLDEEDNDGLHYDPYNGDNTENGLD